MVTPSNLRHCPWCGDAYYAHEVKMHKHGADGPYREPAYVEKYVESQPPPPPKPLPPAPNAAEKWAFAAFAVNAFVLFTHIVTFGLVTEAQGLELGSSCRVIMWASITTIWFFNWRTKRQKRLRGE